MALHAAALEAASIYCSTVGIAATDASCIIFPILLCKSLKLLIVINKTHVAWVLNINYEHRHLKVLGLGFSFVYSVPHEESELMLGMYDVTSIVTIHFT